jgi:hypothetical protein
MILTGFEGSFLSWPERRALADRVRADLAAIG